MTNLILIVEDAKLISLHLKRILENNGYKNIKQAVSGEEALKIVKDQMPDLILMDIMLSGELDGIDTVTAIHEIADTPVIYLTALTDRGTVERAKKTEPYGYIIKPFEADQVVTLIEMALNKYKSELLLRESEQKFKAAVSAIRDCFIFLDEEFKIKFINTSAEKLIDQFLVEVAGKNFYEVFEFYDLETGKEKLNLWASGPDQNVIKLETMYLYDHKNNKIPVGDGIISKVLDHAHKLKGVVITFNNVSDKLDQELLENQLKKKQLAAIIEGQEKERSRIARELHDGLGQSLNAIKLQLNSFALDKEQQKKIERLKLLINESIQESSRISENLLPAKLNDFDISTCIFSLIDHDYQGLKVSFESTGIKNNRLDLTKKINLYRISQEVIANCMKHAEAKNLSIQLRGEGNSIQMTVEDDGKGFNFADQKQKLLEGHNGLQNMMDRVRIMNGKIEFDTQHERGTLIIIDVPY